MEQFHYDKRVAVTQACFKDLLARMREFSTLWKSSTEVQRLEQSHSGVVFLLKKNNIISFWEQK